MYYNATAIVRRRNDGAGFQSGQKAESKIRLNVKINGTYVSGFRVVVELFSVHMKLVPAVDGEVLGVVSGVNATVSQPEGGCFEVKSIARPSVVFEESAPDNLMPSARAAPTPLAYLPRNCRRHLCRLSPNPNPNPSLILILTLTRTES